MLNVGKLAKGQESYYLNAVGRGAEDYYLGSGEAPGRWTGGGAKDLKLSGEVGADELRAVLGGLHPTTGAKLARRIRPDRVPGFDLTFRAPKSVSLLHALSNDKSVRTEVREAHDAAVEAAVGYLERNAGTTRRGYGGTQNVETKGFIAAAFRHRTSRAGDPLLHTHVLVANLLHDKDGSWGALDGRLIYSHAKTAGYLYQAHLRAELTRRLGVEWAPVRRGSADLAGVSRKVIRAFSRRRAEIEERMAARGESGSARAGQVAALDTRRSKDYKVTPQSLLPEWRERAARLGLDDKELRALTDRVSYRALTSSDRRRIAFELAGAEGLTRQASTFTRREALQGFCEAAALGAPVRDIERATDGFLASDLVVPVAGRPETLTSSDSLRRGDGEVVAAARNDRRFSTEEMLETERRVIERALSRRNDGVGVAPKRAVDVALAARPTLYPDQRAMVRRLTSSGQGVEVVVGKAGAGKTFGLDAARDAWQASGHRVIGCALAAQAAQELQAGSGIESYTIKALLQDLEHPESGGLAPNTVMVVDEAGMVGTRMLDELLSHASRADAKVVLVGDDRQLPEIDAGGAFRGIKNRLPVVELNEVRRQPFGWEKEALELVRTGRASEALHLYEQHDRVMLGSTAEQTRRQLVLDWYSTHQDAEPGVMIAARRSDVDDLNRRARTLLLAAGALGDESITIEGRSFAVGDRVMTLRNSRGLGVLNGTRATVEAVDTKRYEITIKTRDDRTIALPKSYLEAGHLTHSYAITGHKAQGMTTDRAFVLGDQTLYREWGYVAMSRGRESNRLYVVAGADPDREEIGGAVTDPKDPMDELKRALGRSHAKELALDDQEHSQIRSMPYAELRGEWEKLQRLLETRPVDPSSALADVRRETERVEAILAEQRSARTKAQAELARLGKLVRVRHRDQVATLEDDIDRLRDSEARLDDILRALRSSEGVLVEEDAVRNQWLLQHAPEIQRHDALRRELWRREQQQAIAAEVAMPTYLLNAVGERPQRPSERGAWRETVRAVEAHRERWNVHDSDNPFGNAPRSERERHDLEALEQRVKTYSRDLEERVVEDGRDLSR